MVERVVNEFVDVDPQATSIGNRCMDPVNPLGGRRGLFHRIKFAGAGGTVGRNKPGGSRWLAGVLRFALGTKVNEASMFNVCHDAERQKSLCYTLLRGG